MVWFRIEHRIRCTWVTQRLLLKSDVMNLNINSNLSATMTEREKKDKCHDLDIKNGFRDGLRGWTYNRYHNSIYFTPNRLYINIRSLLSLETFKCQLCFLVFFFFIIMLSKRLYCHNDPQWLALLDNQIQLKQGNEESRWPSNLLLHEMTLHLITISLILSFHY